MNDPRNKQLAKILVDYSVKTKKGDKIVITCTSFLGLPLAEEVYKLILLKEAFPHFQLQTESLSYLYFKHATRDQLRAEPEIAQFLAGWGDKFITIVAEQNPKELANIDPVKQVLRSKAIKKSRDQIMKKPWMVTYYPTAGMAYASEMSLHELEDLYFSACLKDWRKESENLQRLKLILDKSKKFRIIGFKTDLSMDFTGRFFAICAGEYNMPDGEIFGAPLEDSVNGQVYFDFPSIYHGKEVRGLTLIFKKGKVVSWSADNHREFLNHILNTDPGARRLGEVGIGTNFSITRFMSNTLFDEKMGGTVHLALGAAFKERIEGRGENDSAIHWDLIKDLRKKDSKIIVDDKIILKDGKIL